MENSPKFLQQAVQAVQQLVSEVNSALPKRATKRRLDRSDPSQPELVRCKRRIHFNYLQQTPPVAVARRNERERNRVKLVNLGFASLRQQLPNGAANKKMSKVETLRSAVDYIKQLQDLLDETDAVNAVFNGSLSSTCSLTSSPSPSYSPESSPSEVLTPEEEELVNFTDWFTMTGPCWEYALM